jgi:hypothetical protein
MRGQPDQRGPIWVRALDEFDGLARRDQLLWFGVSNQMIDCFAETGRFLMRVRKGYYASPDEHPEVLRAWRVGGRLTCVSALAFHEGAQAGPVLHVEVPANTARLRDPDYRKHRLGPDAPVVVHWTRHPGRGDQRSVSADHALAVAAGCGVHAAGVRPAAG